MPVGRRFPCLGVVAALVVCPVALAAERIADESMNRVDVLLTTPSTLSNTARAWMMKEAEAIWLQHRVVIDWLPPTVARPVASNRMRVLIVQKRLLSQRPSALVAVGELLRPPDGHPVALVSIDTAQRLIASVRGRTGNDLVSGDERRLGIVLGRALAHEIGHYLLGTPTHASSGLMRPNFDALEFTDPRTGPFALDHDADAWLRARTADKFAYAQR